VTRDRQLSYYKDKNILFVTTYHKNLKNKKKQKKYFQTYFAEKNNHWITSYYENTTHGV